jgi:fatty-acyl-CoA synthase
MGRLGRVTHDSRFLCDSPMFHVIGLVTTIRPAFRVGAAVLLSDGFDAERTLGRLSDPELNVTHYFCVPQMAAALRTRPEFDPTRLRHLTALFTGGAPNPPADIQAWAADGIPVANGFGMSESGTVCHTGIDLPAIDAKAGSVGVPTPGVQVRVADGDGIVLPPGEAGELQLRGPNLFSGYWRRPDETAAAFTSDGWFRTGDIARVDADGSLWIVDRAKDMFISGGENVYPAEIEAALAGHPQVAECAVVGVPDERWGEVGHLAIRPRAESLDVAAVQAFLGERLARYKLPKHVSIVEELPRNGAGKVLKIELRRLLLSQA